ncbi:hypothetical protein [Paenibacillus rhizophilus]|uniref:Uncharacterized protein n=1 Tax=Paenibacillus rhizophilus TaxID=1850366 RepID=A0A3N9NY20_9BACL|nr:hypothetical protein [Paenibacillus rhizophilus]RQW08843.1 hypothetical protein EH198_20845 [Paenibacillus rhizophilus]
MDEDFYTSESLRQHLLEFLKETFDYDGTIHLLAVAARRDGARDKLGESYWRLRLALTYSEGDTVNPYWDGTDLDVALAGNVLRLLDEEALANEPPIVEGSPNALAVNWVSELASPLWVSDEARAAFADGLDKRESKEADWRANSPTEDPFADYFGK